MARVIVEDPNDYGEAPVAAAPESGGGGIWILLALILIVVFLWNYSPITRGQVGTYNPYVGTNANVKYVIVDELNLRDGPSTDSWVSYVLTRNTAVVLLGESRRGYYGDLWVKVGVDTTQGRVIGWVSNRYLA